MALKIPWSLAPCGFDPHLRHHFSITLENLRFRANVSGLKCGERLLKQARAGRSHRRIACCSLMVDAYATSCMVFAKSRPDVGGGSGLFSWRYSSMASSAISSRILGGIHPRRRRFAGAPFPLERCQADQPSKSNRRGGDLPRTRACASRPREGPWRAWRTRRGVVPG